MAAIVRVPILGSGPVFPAPTGALHLDAASYALCIVAGAAAAALALVSTTLVYFSEDTFAYVMADSGRTELPVAERTLPGVAIGTVRLEQLLQGRLRDLDEERHRSRPLRPLELLR